MGKQEQCLGLRIVMGDIEILAGALLFEVHLFTGLDQGVVMEDLFDKVSWGIWVGVVSLLTKWFQHAPSVITHLFNHVHV